MFGMNKGGAFMNSSEAPRRTCCVCRRTDEKKNLLRFVARAKLKSTSDLAIDLAHREPGRGAYVHSKVACLLSVQVLGSVFASLCKVRGKRSIKDLQKQAAKGSIAEILNEAIADTRFDTDFAKNARKQLLQFKAEMQSVKNVGKQIRL